MTLVERITEEARTMPVHAQQQVLDFMQFLKQKEQKHIDKVMDSVLDDFADAWEELAK